MSSPEHWTFSITSLEVENLNRLNQDSSLPDSDISTAGLLSLFAVYFIWGTTFLAIKLGVHGEGAFPPFTLGAMRVLVAGAVLLCWARFRGRKVWLNRREIMVLGFSGLLIWTGANGLVTWAEQYASSGYAALLMAALPIWTTLMEALLDRRIPSKALMLSLAIGFSGVGLLTVPQLLKASPLGFWAGVALLFAPLSWASGSILQVRHSIETEPLVSSAYQNLAGGIGFTFLVLLLGEPVPSPSTQAWLAWGYLVLIGSVVGFTAFVRAINLLPMSLAMTYPFVNPVVAVLLGWWILDEPITPWLMGGMILVLVGVGGVFREKYLPTSPSESSVSEGG
ncbi:MAG: EamA family transporter [Candidatus Acetothermia bacterium]